MIPAGICLAAGASTRMGTPKALLLVSGRPAIFRAVEALLAGGCHPVVAVVGAGGDGIRNAVTLPEGARFALHADWASGRTGSLKAGIRACGPAPAFVILPVDHLMVSAEDVAALVEAWRETRPPVVRPVREGRGGHPVLLDASLVPEVLALLDDAPLREVVRAHRDREVTVPGSAATRYDANTPEDLDRLP